MMLFMVNYSKSFKETADLVKLLKSRGLEINNESKVEEYLNHIGYYRLSAYMYPFLKIPKSSHQYKNGTTFSQVMTIYRFDKRLRMLILMKSKRLKSQSLSIDVFESWLTIIAVTRNSCGHHSRVWNKQNAITPSTLTI